MQTQKIKYILYFGVILLIGGCSNWSGKPAHYPPMLPLSPKTNMPIWIEAPQVWKVGDWIRIKDNGVLKKGKQKIQLIARMPNGIEWWEVRRWKKSKESPVQAIIIRPDGKKKTKYQFVVAYEGAPKTMGTYISWWKVDRIVKDMKSRWNIYGHHRIIPRKKKFDSSSFERYDINIGKRKFHALRLQWKKRVGPGSMIMNMWISPYIPGKMIKVEAVGYLGPIPILSRSREVTSFGNDKNPKPSIKLPPKAWTIINRKL
jgi:hypothetical protein